MTRLGRRTVAVLAATMTLFFCASVLFAAEAAAPDTSGVKIDGEYGPFLPSDVSVHGWQIDRLINIVHVFMAIMFVGWGVFFVHCLFRYRRATCPTAQHELIKAKPTKYIEVAVMVFEVVLLVFFSMPVWASVKNDLPTAEQNPVRIRVLAEQFAWNFHYPGPDGVFGRTGPEFVDVAMNPAGLDKIGDPHAKDDIVKGEMHVPVDTPVICDIMSKDVIHSFFVPVLRVKQDAIPGMRIPSWFKATKSGKYEVACAQLCGNNHYKMKAILVIEPRPSFDKWMTEAGKIEEFEGE